MVHVFKQFQKYRVTFTEIRSYQSRTRQIVGAYLNDPVEGKSAFTLRPAGGIVQINRGAMTKVEEVPDSIPSGSVSIRAVSAKIRKPDLDMTPGGRNGMIFKAKT